MRLQNPASHRPIMVFLSIILLLIGLISISFSAETSPLQPTAGDVWELTYQIDRSQVPSLYYNDLTLRTHVGDVDNVYVEMDGSAVPFDYNVSSGIVQVTTRGSNIYLRFEGAQDAEMPAPISKASLLENKKWAWSHGFDDNVALKPSIEAFNSFGWRATLFMITSQIHETRRESWVVDKLDLLDYLDGGWSLGSHGHLNNCDDANETAQLTALNRLADIVDDSNSTSFKVISFAVPCFYENEYAPIAIDIIEDGNTDLLFYETGNNYLRLVDEAHVRPHGTTTLPSYSAGNITALGLVNTGPLGRDYRIQNSGNDLNLVKGQFDWMASNASADRHFWYNTLAHGGSESTITEVLTYVYNSYGPSGTGEAWVAPSDQIYSYIQVRDNSQVTLTSIKKSGVPWIQSTVVATISPTPTNTPTPLATPTSSTAQPDPSSTPTPTATASNTPEFTPTALMEPVGCNLLKNGDFEDGLQGWEDHGTLTLIEDAYHRDQALRVAQGWAGQIISVDEVKNLVLKGYFQTPNNIGWTGVGVDFLDEVGNEISEEISRLSGNSQYAPFELNVASPSNTVALRFWINSASGGEIIVDYLELAQADCVESTATPIPTQTNTFTPTTISAVAVSETATLVTPNPVDSWSIYLPVVIR